MTDLGREGGSSEGDRGERLRSAENQPSALGGMLLLGLVAFLASGLAGFWYLDKLAPPGSMRALGEPDGASFGKGRPGDLTPGRDQVEDKIVPAQDAIVYPGPEEAAEPETAPPAAPAELSLPVPDALPPEPPAIDSRTPEEAAEAETALPSAPAELSPPVIETLPDEPMGEPAPRSRVSAPNAAGRSATSAWARDGTLESELAGRGVNGVTIFRKGRSLRLRGTVQNDYQLRLLYQFVHEKGFGEVDYGVEVP